MINKLLFFKILLLIILSSCSEYRKILRSTGYQKKLDAAMKYYEEEKYFKASTFDFIFIFRRPTNLETTHYPCSFSSLGEFMVTPPDWPPWLLYQ